METMPRLSLRNIRLDRRLFLSDSFPFSHFSFDSIYRPIHLFRLFMPSICHNCWCCIFFFFLTIYFYVVAYLFPSRSPSIQGKQPGNQINNLEKFLIFFPLCNLFLKGRTFTERVAFNASTKERTRSWRIGDNYKASKCELLIEFYFLVDIAEHIFHWVSLLDRHILLSVYPLDF